MRAAACSPAVTLTTARLWRLRLTQSMPRYLLSLAAGAGLLASARFAIAPPHGAGPTTRDAAQPVADRAAEGYAVLFARRYLAWDAANPQASERLLAPMDGSAITAGAGPALPAAGSQSVEWAEVVQAREPEAGAHVYTVAAQIEGRGVVYLAVDVARRADGRLVLWGYPAFVGAPEQGGASLAQAGPAIADGPLAAVVRRALRNYLAGATDDLDADLSPGARVAVPGLTLTLDAVERLAWSRDRSSVVATLRAHDDRGARYTLGYELDVAEIGGRWEVSAIEMDPRQ